MLSQHNVLGEEEGEIKKVTAPLEAVCHHSFAMLVVVTFKCWQRQWRMLTRLF